MTDEIANAASIIDDIVICAEAGDLDPIIYKLEFMDAPLTKNERIFLAEFLKGNKKKSPNRPKRTSPRFRWEALAILDVILCLEEENSTRDYAKDEAAKICRMDKSTINRRLKMITPDDEMARKKYWQEFHRRCDAIAMRDPARGEWHRSVRVRNTLSGDLYRSSIVKAKSR